MQTKLHTAVLFIKDDKLLLLEDAQQPNRLKFPGGGVEVEETFLEAAIREVHEELGVTVKTADLQPLHCVDFFFAEEWHYISCFFLATTWQGDFENLLPDEHAALVWAPSTELPATVLEPFRLAVSKGLSGTFYSSWRPKN